MALWGSLFPAVKLGYRAFQIDTGSVADVLMFAAMRFTVCGFLVSLFCLFRRKKAPVPKAPALLKIVLVGLFAVVLHYACTYIGLTTTDSSKTALIKQAGSLIYVCFAFLFFKDEKFSIWKIAGALIGFAGIVAINWSGNRVTFRIGDLLILAASVCTVISGVLSRYAVRDASPLWVTGISQLSGGLILLIVALLMGGALPKPTPGGILIFTYICAASVTGYTLWYYILKSTELSKLYIIKFAEPLFACLFGALLLSENILKWQYAAAFILISLGIILGHLETKKAAADKSSAADPE